MQVWWKIERFERQGDNQWSSTPDVITTISNPHNIIVMDSLGDGKDTFQWKETNFDNELDSFYKIGDKVIISRKVDSSTFDSEDVVMTGIVQDVPYDVDGEKNIQTVKGGNYTELLMNAITFVTDEGLRLNEYLEQALIRVNAYNNNFQVIWSGDNPTLKTDDTQFPIVNEKWYNKSLMKLLEKYSTASNTEDTNYYFYVSRDNELIWKPRTNKIDYSFNSETNNNYTTLSISKNKDGVINFVINKGQTSPRGNIISIRYDDPVSRSKNGFKPYIMTSQANYVDEIRERNGIEDGNLPDSYPFTVNTSGWLTKDSDFDVDSDKEYDDAVIAEVKFRLRRDARSFVRERRDGKIEVEVSFPPGTAIPDSNQPWPLGAVVSVTIPQINKKNNIMRVDSRNITTSDETYVLIEDEGTATE